MIKIFGKMRYHWQPELSWSIIYWSIAVAPMFIGLSLLFERTKNTKSIFLSYLLSLLCWLVFGFSSVFRYRRQWKITDCFFESF